MTDETIFAGALEKADPAERAAFLTEVCGDDTERRRRLEGLLAAHAGAGGFLERPPVAALDRDEVETRTIGDDGEAPADGDEVPLTFLAPASRPDSLGRIGHYEVLQLLGQGGFGIVLRAFDDMLQRVVAVKVLSPQLAATSPARKRFLREARSSAQVRHENVVQTYEIGEQPLPYIVMEFIPGETLRQRLDRIGPLDVPDVLRIGRQIAEGLAAAHAMELIHRDIKPGNILLEGGSQRVKISDFGLARAADDASLSQSGLIAGTPMYMAPEQAKGETLDQRADLFSLGSVLYQMVTGRPPFRANTTVAVLKRVAEDKPRAIREIIPETPQWLCDIIAKLHAQNPDDRYQSAREVADALADCEAQLKANAKLKDYSRIPKSKPAAARSRRWKWAAAAALLLPVLALAVTEITGVTHLFRGQEQTTDTSKPGNHPRTILVAKRETPPLADAPFTDADVQRIAALPAADRRAAEYVLSIGGAVKVNEQDQEIKTAADLPRESFRLTGVRLTDNKRVSDAGLAHFRDCRGLRHLDLDGTQVSDAGVAHLQDCVAGLTELWLGRTRVTDAGLAYFKGCTRLRHLNLIGTRVSDAGLAHFTGCKSLQHLYLWDTQVSDAGLAYFTGCHDLRNLGLYNTKVTDTGLAHFKDCKKLGGLQLSGTNVTDAGLAHFKDCKNLSYIYLGKTKVTDAGLALLAELDRLTALDLRGTQVTEKGVVGLAKALPKCKIEWDDGVIEPK